MYLCKLRFFPDFYVCATTRPSFAGLLRHSVTTGSHEPVIQIPISVIWHQQQCLFKRENMAYFREYIISPQGLLQQLLCGHAGTALGWPLSTGFESASVVVMPNTVPRRD